MNQFEDLRGVKYLKVRSAKSKHQPDEIQGTNSFFELGSIQRKHAGNDRVLYERLVIHQLGTGECCQRVQE